MTNVQVLSLTLEAIVSVGVVVYLLLIWLRLEGLAALRRENRNGDARYVSRSDIRRHSMLLAILLLYLALAVAVHITAFRGQHISEFERWVTMQVGILLRVVLIGSAAIIAVKGIWEVRDWEHLTRLKWHEVVSEALQRHVSEAARWVTRRRS